MWCWCQKLLVSKIQMTRADLNWDNSWFTNIYNKMYKITNDRADLKVSQFTFHCSTTFTKLRITTFSCYSPMKLGFFIITLSPSAALVFQRLQTRVQVDTRNWETQLLFFLSISLWTFLLIYRCLASTLWGMKPRILSKTLSGRVWIGHTWRRR